MLGLFAFFLLVLHFLTYLGPDQSFNFSGMWDDVAKRKFVTVDFAAFVLLIPLAATSPPDDSEAGRQATAGSTPANLHLRDFGVIHYYGW